MMPSEATSLRQRGFAVIALGDFNSKIGKIPGLEGNKDGENSNSNLFKTFVGSLNLVILNTLPICEGLFTHFVEKSDEPDKESVLDYGLADPDLTPFITSFVIDADSRYSCGTDHALLMASIDFSTKIEIQTHFSDVLQFRLPHDKDYSNFNLNFSEHPDLPSLDQFTQLTASGMTERLKHVLFDTCCKTFLPPKSKKKKKHRNWLPPNIVKHLKLRKFLQKEFSKSKKNMANFSSEDPFIKHLWSFIEETKV